MKSRLVWVGAVFLCFSSLSTWGGCSFDVVRVNPNRVKAAQKASDPLQRGPGAPGFFKQEWSFAGPAGGYLFDPSKVEMVNGIARVKPIGPKGKDNYPTEAQGVILQTIQGSPYLVLDSFEEIKAPGHQGTVKYQLSPDGSRWFFHNGTKWVPAGPSTATANTAQELNSTIMKFNDQVGEGSLYVKAFLFSSTGKEPILMKGFAATGIAPQFDEPSHH